MPGNEESVVAQGSEEMRSPLFEKKCSKSGLHSYGDPAGTRTPDLRLKRALLYQLSY